MALARGDICNDSNVDRSSAVSLGSGPASSMARLRVNANSARAASDAAGGLAVNDSATEVSTGPDTLPQ